MTDNKKIARWAGLLYLIIFIGAGFGYGFIQSNILVPGDATATAINMRALETWVRVGVAASAIAFVCDIGVAVIFYMLLKPVGKLLSLFAAFLRLVQTSILGMNLLCLLAALSFTGSADLSTSSAENIFTLLHWYQYGFDIAMVFFGVHCLVVGYLLYRSELFPAFLGVLLAVAAIAYLLDSFTKFLVPDFAAITAWIVGITAVVAELALTLWLLIKGVKPGMIVSKKQ